MAVCLGKWSLVGLRKTGFSTYDFPVHNDWRVYALLLNTAACLWGQPMDK